MFRFRTCAHYSPDKSCKINAAPPVAMPMVCNSCKEYEGPMRDIDPKYVRNDPVFSLPQFKAAQVHPPTATPPVSQPPRSVGERKSFLSKAISYAKAEVSLLTQFISEEDVRKRLDACQGCSNLKPSREPGQLGWCGACGCGKNARAELTVKVRMPAATCPLGKW